MRSGSVPKSSIVSIILPSALIWICSRVKSSDFDDLKNSKKLLDSLILLHHSVNKYCAGQNDTDNIANLDNVYNSKRSCAVQLECLVSLAINRLSTHLITKTDLDSSSHEYWLDSVLFSNSTYIQENLENSREEFLKVLFSKRNRSRMATVVQG